MGLGYRFMDYRSMAAWNGQHYLKVATCRAPAESLAKRVLVTSAIVKVAREFHTN